MQPGIATSVLALAATALTVTWPTSSAALPKSVDADQAAQPKAAGFTTPLAMMNLTPRKPLVRPYGEIRRKPEADRVPTSVSYKPFAKGPVGSVGLVRFNASHALDSSALGNASAGQPGPPTQTLGANLFYGFR